MAKKLFSIFLIFSFFNLTLSIIMPELVKTGIAFAEETDEDEDQAEKDANQQRAVAGAIGFVALMGGIYLVYRMLKSDDSKSSSNSIEEKKKYFAALTPKSETEKKSYDLNFLRGDLKTY